MWSPNTSGTRMAARFPPPPSSIIIHFILAPYDGLMLETAVHFSFNKLNEIRFGKDTLYNEPFLN